MYRGFGFSDTVYMRSLQLWSLSDGRCLHILVCIMYTVHNILIFCIYQLSDCYLAMLIESICWRRLHVAGQATKSRIEALSYTIVGPKVNRRYTLTFCRLIICYTTIIMHASATQPNSVM